MSKVQVGYKNLLDDETTFKEIEANSLLVAAYKYAKVESDEIYKAIIDEKVALVLNGEILEVDKWKYTSVKDNDKIEIVSTLSGGKGKFLGFVMIAIGIAAILFAPAIAPITFAGMEISQSTIVMFGISQILSGMTRLLFSPDLPNSPVGSNRETQTYSWSGIKTTVRSDTRIPIIYGTCMVGGNVISAFTDIKNNDSYLNMLIALGEGEIQGICQEKDHSSICPTSDQSDTAYADPAIFIDDQPLSNYSDVEWWYRSGTNEEDKTLDNLVAAYNFDENEGTTLTDISGNGNDGIIYGSPTWVTGKSGYALDFYGDTNVVYASIQNYPTSAFSVCGWIYLETVNVSNRICASKWVSASVNGWILWVTSSAYVQFGISELTTQYTVNSDQALSLPGWHFVVGTYDGTTLKLCIDGVKQTQETTKTLTFSEMHLGIGELDGNDPRYIDEVRIYNRALSADEIINLYNHPTGIQNQYHPYTQNLIPYFDGAREQISDGRELTSSWLTYTTSKEVDSVDIHIKTPALYASSSTSGPEPNSVSINLQFKEHSEGSYHTYNFTRWTPHAVNQNGYKVDRYINDQYLWGETKPPTYYIKAENIAYQTDTTVTQKGTYSRTWAKEITFRIKDSHNNIKYETVTFGYYGDSGRIISAEPYAVYVGTFVNSWYTLHVYSTSTTTTNYRVYGLTKTGIVKTIHLDFNTIANAIGKGKYDIQIRRTNEASSDFNISDNIYFKNIIERVNGDFIYPNTALLGIRIKATNQLSGGLPNIKTLVKGLKVEVPDTSGTEDFDDLFYNETLDRFETVGGSERTWDETTYRTEFSENSMLCVRDLILSDRYGIGKYLTTSDLYTSGIVSAIKSCWRKWYPTVVDYLSWFSSGINWSSNWNFVTGSGSGDSSTRTISASGSNVYAIEVRASSFISPSVSHNFKITLASVTGNNVNIDLYGVQSSTSTNILLGSASDKENGQHTITFTPTSSGIRSFIIHVENKDLASGNTANISFDITALELENVSTSAEHLHTMNGVIDSKQSATTAIYEACDSFRCWPVWFKGTYNFILNEDVTPIHNITAGNIKDFSESFTPLSEIPYKVEGQYLDKDLDYEMKSIIARTTDTTIPKSRENTIGLKWLTDRKRAEREIKFKLNGMVNISNSVNFKCGLDSIHATAGDVVNIQHPVPQWGSGGRILSYNQASSYVVLDDSFTFDDVTATILLKYQTDENSFMTATVDTSGLSNGDVEQRINLVSWPPSNPVNDSVYLIGKTSSIKPFRLTKVARNSDNEVEVSAIEHVPEIYSEPDIVVIRDNYSDLPQISNTNVRPNPPVEFSVQMTDVIFGIGFEFTIDVGNQNIKETIIQMSTDQTVGYQTLLVVDSNQNTARYVNNNLGIGNTYYFRAFCRNESKTSDFVYGSITIDPKDYQPIAPTGIHIKGMSPNSNTFYDKDVIIKWNAVGAVYNSPGPLSGYVVKVYKNSVSSENLLRTAFVKSEEFLYTFDDNVSDSGGTPSATLVFVLQSQTSSNISSEDSIPFKVQNSTPATIGAVRATTSWNNVIFDWDTSSERDHKKYKYRAKVGSQSYTSWTDTNANMYAYTLNATDISLYPSSANVKLQVKDVDQFDQESSVNASTTGNVIVWADQNDYTQLNGDNLASYSVAGDKIAVNAVAASQIYVDQLSAISANMGEITAGIITGANIRTASSGKRTVMNSDGLRAETGATAFTYGDSSYKYGDSSRKYGSGVLAYFLHNSKSIPFYVNEEQTVADIHLYDRSADPTGAAEKGDLCVVNGILKICVTSSTPGVWATVGSQA